MTRENLARGKELYELINISKAALSNLIEMKKENQQYEIDGKFHEDYCYSLCISKHSDGSGSRADLNRYFGNQELLDIIIHTLEKQIKDFEETLKNI